MQILRRDLLCLTVISALFGLASRAAGAEAYPTRPVHLISGFAAGGPNDIAARLIGQWLSERLDRQVVIENRSGASGNIATELVMRAPADGHTLLMVGPSVAINGSLYDNLGFDFIRDSAPVAGFMRAPFVMLVNPSFPARTVPEFIAYAKANPGRINMASSGPRSASQLFGELFRMLAGIDVISVPYRGAGPALIDLIGGRMQVIFEGTGSSIGYIRAGRLRALAVTATTRSATLPDVPTVGEFVPGYEASAWYGVAAPKGTPAEIIDRLNREIAAGLGDQVLQRRIADLGGAPMQMTPAEFGKLVADETAKWANVIRAAGMKPE